MQRTRRLLCEQGERCADAPVIANPGELELAKKLIERVRSPFSLSAMIFHLSKMLFLLP